MALTRDPATMSEDEKVAVIHALRMVSPFLFCIITSICAWQSDFIRLYSASIKFSVINHAMMLLILNPKNTHYLPSATSVVSEIKPALCDWYVICEQRK